MRLCIKSHAIEFFLILIIHKQQHKNDISADHLFPLCPITNFKDRFSWGLLIVIFYNIDLQYKYENTKTTPDAQRLRICQMYQYWKMLAVNEDLKVRDSFTLLVVRVRSHWALAMLLALAAITKNGYSTHSLAKLSTHFCIANYEFSVNGP